MPKQITTFSDYNTTLKKLLILIRKNKAQAISSVNTILIKTYWEIWKEIVEKKKKEWWWTKILERLSYDLKQEFPWEKGFSVANLKNMALFYKEFPEISEPLAHQLSWTNHILIIKSCISEEERKFYRIFAVKENWSKRELKITSFKAEYVWQVNKYIWYLNKYKKKSFENSAIWLILCKDAKQETVEFALDWLEDKMKVAVYKSLPSQEILQEQVKKIEEKLWIKN